MSDARPLVELIRRLSASNLSVLRATLDTLDSQIATTANSANDILWSAFVDRGLARELTLDLDVPLPPGFQPKTFALTDEGRARLPQLLSEAFDESDS
jgi:hypothetical protein